MKKWAIYQDTYGKYARHYIDTIEELNKTHLKTFVTTITLPIVMNRGLGYSSFELEYDKKNGFLEIVENENFPLSRNDMFPKNHENFLYGWIDPEGNTYACNFEDHYYASEFLCEERGYKGYNSERVLEEAGWIKISRKPPYTPDNTEQIPYSATFRITQAQYKTLCDIGLDDNMYVKAWFENSEPTW